MAETTIKVIDGKGQKVIANSTPQLAVSKKDSVVLTGKSKEKKMGKVKEKGKAKKEEKESMNKIYDSTRKAEEEEKESMNKIDHDEVTVVEERSSVGILFDNTGIVETNTPDSGWWHYLEPSSVYSTRSSNSRNVLNDETTLPSTSNSAMSLDWPKKYLAVNETNDFVSGQLPHNFQASLRIESGNSPVELTSTEHLQILRRQTNTLQKDLSHIFQGASLHNSQEVQYNNTPNSPPVASVLYTRGHDSFSHASNDMEEVETISNKSTHRSRSEQRKRTQLRKTTNKSYGHPETFDDVHEDGSHQSIEKKSVSQCTPLSEPPEEKLEDPEYLQEHSEVEATETNTMPFNNNNNKIRKQSADPDVFQLAFTKLHSSHSQSNKSDNESSLSSSSTSGLDSSPARNVRPFKDKKNKRKSVDRFNAGCDEDSNSNINSETTRSKSRIHGEHTDRKSLTLITSVTSHFEDTTNVDLSSVNNNILLCTDPDIEVEKSYQPLKRKRPKPSLNVKQFEVVTEEDSMSEIPEVIHGNIDKEDPVTTNVNDIDKEVGGLAQPCEETVVIECNKMMHSKDKPSDEIIETVKIHTDILKPETEATNSYMTPVLNNTNTISIVSQQESSTIPSNEVVEVVSKELQVDTFNSRELSNNSKLSFIHAGASNNTIKQTLSEDNNDIEQSGTGDSSNSTNSPALGSGSIFSIAEESGVLSNGVSESEKRHQHPLKRAKVKLSSNVISDQIESAIDESSNSRAQDIPETNLQKSGSDSNKSNYSENIGKPPGNDDDANNSKAETCVTTNLNLSSCHRSSISEHSNESLKIDEQLFSDQDTGILSVEWVKSKTSFRKKLKTLPSHNSGLNKTNKEKELSSASHESNQNSSTTKADHLVPKKNYSKTTSDDESGTSSIFDTRSKSQLSSSITHKNGSSNNKDKLMLLAATGASSISSVQNNQRSKSPQLKNKAKAKRTLDVNQFQAVAMEVNDSGTNKEKGLSSASQESNQNSMTTKSGQLVSKNDYSKITLDDEISTSSIFDTRLKSQLSSSITHEKSSSNNKDKLVLTAATGASSISSVQNSQRSKSPHFKNKAKAKRKEKGLSSASQESNQNSVTTKSGQSVSEKDYSKITLDDEISTSSIFDTRSKSQLSSNITHKKSNSNNATCATPQESAHFITNQEERFQSHTKNTGSVHEIHPLKPDYSSKSNVRNSPTSSSDECISVSQPLKRKVQSRLPSNTTHFEVAECRENSDLDTYDARLKSQKFIVSKVITEEISAVSSRISDVDRESVTSDHQLRLVREREQTKRLSTALQFQAAEHKETVDPEKLKLQKSVHSDVSKNEENTSVKKALSVLTLSSPSNQDIDPSNSVKRPLKRMKSKQTSNARVFEGAFEEDHSNSKQKSVNSNKNKSSSVDPVGHTAQALLRRETHATTSQPENPISSYMDANTSLRISQEVVSGNHKVTSHSNRSESQILEEVSRSEVLDEVSERQHHPIHEASTTIQEIVESQTNTCGKEVNVSHVIARYAELPLQHCETTLISHQRQGTPIPLHMDDKAQRNVATPDARNIYSYRTRHLRKVASMEETSNPEMKEKTPKNIAIQPDESINISAYSIAFNPQMHSTALTVESSRKKLKPTESIQSMKTNVGQGSAPKKLNYSETDPTSILCNAESQNSSISSAVEMNMNNSSIRPKSKDQEKHPVSKTTHVDTSEINNIIQSKGEKKKISSPIVSERSVQQQLFNESLRLERTLILNENAETNYRPSPVLGKITKPFGKRTAYNHRLRENQNVSVIEEVSNNADNVNESQDISDSVSSRSTSESHYSRMIEHQQRYEQSREEDDLKLERFLQESKKSALEKQKIVSEKFDKKYKKLKTIKEYFCAVQKNSNHIPEPTPKKPRTIDPDFLVNGKRYCVPPLARPKQWVSDKLYEKVIKVCEKKYGTLRSRRKAEEFMQHLCKLVTTAINRKKKYLEPVEAVKKELYNIGLIKTLLNFHVFVENYLPQEFREKAIPCLRAYGIISGPPSVTHSQLFEELSF